MNRVCVVTSKAGAYYTIVSRLRRAGLPFESMLPGSNSRDCELVITTSDEAENFGERAVVLEELDENPEVFKGQIVSRLKGGDGVLLIGVDPGTRIGMAVFYGETALAFDTFGSAVGLCSRVGIFARRVPSKGLVLRVGNGNPSMTARLIEPLKREAPDAAIEIVDESGTSTRTARIGGVKGDQNAAARIAFRKGEVVNPGGSRTRAQGSPSPPG